MKLLSKQSLFWLGITLLSGTGIIVSRILFSLASPIINLDIRMNRNEALEKAAEIAEKHQFQPVKYQAAVSFLTDSETKTYVELEAGGVKAFEDMMEKNLFMPYQWHVRHFSPGDSHEITFYFTPAGQPYGFTQKLSENDPGANIDSAQARKIAEHAATSDWNINFADYQLVETCKNVAPSGRGDHTFVYERQDIKIGQALYRLKLTVSGDKISQVYPYVKIPESFKLSYIQMRSANNNIAYAAVIAMYLLYILGGGIIGLFFLMRKRWVIISFPFYCALGLSFLQFLTKINELPQYWMEYSTALSPHLFLSKILFSSFYEFLFYTGFYTIVIAAAETFTRKAFSKHIQLWKIWSYPHAASPEIIARTIGGYLFVSIMLGYVIILYFITQKYFGWWTPADTLFDPNILATYAPWLGVIVQSLIAGFTEECLFRAIPLAGGALIGERLGKRRLFIALAFIIQIIIFGAAHANYSCQPSYARLVELIIPSALFGALYLYFGLLLTVIFHVTYDVFWFALPLFLSHAPGSFINQLIVIIITSIPILIIAYQWIKKGSLSKLDASAYNNSWQPAAAAKDLLESPISQEYKTFSRTPLFILIIVLIIPLSTYLINRKQDAPPLNISRAQAIDISKNEWLKKNVELVSPWQPLSQINSSFEETNILNMRHRYIWQLSPQLYRMLLGSYLLPPYWYIRYVRLSGSIIERAEEFDAVIFNESAKIRLAHQLPQEAPGASLEENAARQLALAELSTRFDKKPEQVKEISAEKSQHPSRTDWLFSFADTGIPELDQEQARINISIAGDQIADAYQFIQVPEDWSRRYQAGKAFLDLLAEFFDLLVYLLLIVGLAIAALHLTQSHINWAELLLMFGSMQIILTLLLFNRYPQMVGGFNTTEPFISQLFMNVSGSLIGNIFKAGMLTLLIYLITKVKGIWTTEKNILNALWAVSVGMAIAILGAYINLCFAPVKPLWAHYGSLGGILPLSFMANSLMAWLNTTIIATVICLALQELQRRFALPAWLRGCIIMLFTTIIMGSNSIDSITIWLISSLIIGGAMWLAYEYIFKYDFSLISLACASLFGLGIIQQALFNPYPYCRVQCAVALVLIFGLSFWWYKTINTNNAKELA